MKRNRLAASKVEELVYVHSNLHLLTYKQNQYKEGGTLSSLESNSQHASRCASDTGDTCGSIDLDFLDDPYDADY